MKKKKKQTFALLPFNTNSHLHTWQITGIHLLLSRIITGSNDYKHSELELLNNLRTIKPLMLDPARDNESI